jgi:signal recognition particle receptor subunit beta
MALINFAQREITAKIVYFGAPGAGTNTNVRTLFDLLPVQEKSRLHQFGPSQVTEQSWYFEYVPPEGGLVTGFSTRYRVYSLPGGLDHEAHREEVFRGADSVVFVADARGSRALANIDSLLELERLLKGQGLELAAIPLVIQVNHTDADDARTAEEVVVDLNPFGFPVVSAIARLSRGVLETHQQLTTRTSDRIRDNLAGGQTAITLTAMPRRVTERDDDVIAKHVAAIEAAERPGDRPSLEYAITDIQRGLAAGFRQLAPGPRLEMGLQPKDFLGSRPIYLLGSKLDGDQIVVDIVMARMSGGEPRRLAVVLANRPATATPIPKTPAPAKREMVTGVPERIDPIHPEPADFPPVWYGVAGIAGGTAVGILIGFLLFG